ncbi:MAG TPA: proline dehydrogenase family protein, partial [Limnochordia bacterium]
MLETVKLDRHKLEAETQAIGRELYERVRRHSGRAWYPGRWTQRLMDWSIRHPEARLQLFRFVDVLPALESNDALVEHVREYFGDGPFPFAGLLSTGLELAAKSSVARAALAAAVRGGVKQVAHTFVAGSTPEEALATAEAHRRRGMGFSLDLLGEATLSDAEAIAYQNRYLQLLDALAKATRGWKEVEQIDRAPWGPLPRINVSLKLSALDPRLDPIAPERSLKTVSERLGSILAKAEAVGAHVHVDMEEYRLKDLTFFLFESIAGSERWRDRRALGIVLQAYLKESDADADRLLEWVRRRGTPITVRLVRGAYWDYEVAFARLSGWPIPVFETKTETDERFEQLVERFLSAADVIDLAVGSHNLRSVARALAVARTLGLPPRTIEFQLLYGMADPLKAALVEMGERVRVYMPFGELIPGMAYLVRRLLENTSNESFLRQGFAEGMPVEHLLRPPLAHPQSVGESKNGRAKAASDAVDTEPLERGKDGLTPFMNEPPTDFHWAKARRDMETALREVRDRFGARYPVVIDGKQRHTGGEIASVNPSRPAETIGVSGSASAAEAEEAVRIAARATAWMEMPVSERAAVLKRAAAAMQARRFELAAWMVFEAGKPWREADADVAEAIDFLRFYADQAQALQTPRRLGDLAGELNQLIYEPRGVAVVIAPWNFPLAILTGMTAGALATGNAVIMKPAEQTPVVAAHLYEILRQAGVPADAIHYLPGEGEVVGDALVRHSGVHVIAFTGSRAVGCGILEAAAQIAPSQRHIKRVIAELGGKNAVIIDEDADLDEAVHGVIHSAFGYAGQKCSAASRAIAVGAVYEPFLARLIEAARSLPIGP